MQSTLFSSLIWYPQGLPGVINEDKSQTLSPAECGPQPLPQIYYYLKLINLQLCY